MGKIKNILLRAGSGKGRDLPPYCVLSAPQNVNYEGREHYRLGVVGVVLDMCLWRRSVRVKYGFSIAEDVCVCGNVDRRRFCFSDVYHPHLRIEAGEGGYMGYFGRFSECNNRARSCFVAVGGGRKYMFEGANLRIVLNNLMAMQVYLKFRDRFWSKLLRGRKMRDLRWRLLNMLLGVDWSWLVTVYDDEHIRGFVNELIGVYKRIVFALLDDFDCYVVGFEEGSSPFLLVRVERDVVKNLVDDAVPRLIMDWLVGIVFGERLEQGVNVRLRERWRGGVVSLVEELVLNGKMEVIGCK
jgi:hypothetical protein